MKKLYGLVVVLGVFGLLLSCQTSKGTAGTTEWPITPGKSIIQTDVLGFSPTSESGNTTISFSLYFANAEQLEKWNFVISDADGKRVMRRSGNGLNLPSSISWNGRDDSGKYAAESTYVATLTTNYGRSLPESTETSTPFILGIARPTARIQVSPAFFSPMSDFDKVTITIVPDKHLARIASWSVEIFDPALNLFMVFNEKWPTNSISWNGRGLDGDLVFSAEDYPVIVKLRDEFGNVGIITTTIPIDILVIQDGANYRIENSRVYFKDFTADYNDVGNDLFQQNALRLDQLADKLKKYPDHRVVIVGHAVMLHWDDSRLGKIEQEQILVPLSKARAEAIKSAMVERGVPARMITTEGAGASEPLVPNSDYNNRWINRRTAILLIK